VSSERAQTIGSSFPQLLRIARRLNHQARRRGLDRRLPPLWFVTDPTRTPDPIAVAAHLPRGCGVIYRHFGAPDRVTVARALARVCRKQGLVLLVAADPGLARRVRADGVHWPERRFRGRVGAGRLQTAAAHGLAGLTRAARRGANAALLSPVFDSRSPSTGQSLGPKRARFLAHASAVPVYALGGVNGSTARALSGGPFCGLAAIDGILEAER
jgi:thiamine-phosphate pyrophosphorylase